MSKCTMRSLTSLLLAVIVLSSLMSCDAAEEEIHPVGLQDSARELGLEETFKIAGPLFKYETLQFDLEFVVSDFMGDNFVTYEVYDGHLCRDGNNDITNSTYLSSRLRPDLKPVGDGNGFRNMKVTLNIDADEIASSPIFEAMETYALVYFCVRLNVLNMDYFDPEALEVNFVETPVLLTINLVDGFTIGGGHVSNTDLVVKLAYDDSAVEAYICDTDTNVIATGPKDQGETVRVCVTPTAQTLEQGAYLRYIDEFTFTRETFAQVAISPGTGGVAATPLTYVSCEPGAVICAFETLLGSDFFTDGTGTLFGYGTAFLQLGQLNLGESTARRLEANDGMSAEELLAARPTQFKFEIISVPGVNEFAGVSSAPIQVIASTATLLGMILVCSSILW